MTVYRTSWSTGLHNEHADHATRARAEAHEAALRRRGFALVAVFPVDIIEGEA